MKPRVEGSEFADRRNLLRTDLAAAKLDGMIVASAANLRYLTGFTGSHGVLLLTLEDAILFTDPRYEIQAAQQTSCRVKVAKRSPLHDLVKRLRPGRRIGFEDRHLVYQSHAFLKERLPHRARLEPVEGLVERRRMLKSAGEIELIRASVRTNSAAFESQLPRIRPGMSECELAAALDFAMRKAGAEKPAFETIVAAGRRAALPHARPTHNAIGSNELLLIDMGACQDGYMSDMTRVISLGRPSGKAKRLYAAVLEAQRAALDAIRPGISVQSVDRVARASLRRTGLDQFFVHSTGHGLGLEIHEPPRIGKKEKIKLEAGMVVTIEPGVYLEDFGGMRIEDTVLVTSRGCEVLTPTSKELVVL